MNTKPWYKSKTVYAATAGILYGVMGYVSGNLAITDAALAIEVALVSLGLRFGNGIKLSK